MNNRKKIEGRGGGEAQGVAAPPPPKKKPAGGCQEGPTERNIFSIFDILSWNISMHFDTNEEHRCVCRGKVSGQIGDS
jgi:hypothetical protein